MERQQYLLLNSVYTKEAPVGFKSITEIHRFVAHPTSIVVNGDICTGSSSLTAALAKTMCMKAFDVGQLIRRATRMLSYGDQWEGLVGDWAQSIWNKTVKRINTPGYVVEGRLVGLQAKDNATVLKILCVANEGVVFDRYVNRRGLPVDHDVAKAVNERRERDTRILALGWGKSRVDLLKPGLYDIVVDTSQTETQDIVEEISEYMKMGTSRDLLNQLNRRSSTQSSV